MGDLTRLYSMHPAIPLEKCVYLELKAAAGLQQGGHSPGALLPIAAQTRDSSCVLQWREISLTELAGLDPKRITELGAEAVALALVAELKGWVVVARMREGQFADWLLKDASGRRIALEISGCAREDRGRLGEKLAQVAKCRFADERVACVVEFGPPRASLASVGEAS